MSKIERGVRGLLAAAACIASLVSYPGCGSPAQPTPSQPIPLYVPPPYVPPLPANASLAIEELTFLRNDGPPFGYDVRFQLRETSGGSGATIKNVFVGDSRGGGDNTGPSCWGVALRVPPGGMLDTFYTDAGRDWLGYCAVGFSLPTEEARVFVDFVDDDGRSGIAGVTVLAPR